MADDPLDVQAAVKRAANAQLGEAELARRLDREESARTAATLEAIETFLRVMRDAGNPGAKMMRVDSMRRGLKARLVGDVPSRGRGWVVAHGAGDGLHDAVVLMTNGTMWTYGEPRTIGTGAHHKEKFRGGLAHRWNLERAKGHYSWSDRNRHGASYAEEAIVSSIGAIIAEHGLTWPS